MPIYQGKVGQCRTYICFGGNKISAPAEVRRCASKVTYAYISRGIIRLRGGNHVTPSQSRNKKAIINLAVAKKA